MKKLEGFFNPEAQKFLEEHGNAITDLNNIKEDIGLSMFEEEAAEPNSF